MTSTLIAVLTFHVILHFNVLSFLEWKSSCVSVSPSTLLNQLIDFHETCCAHYAAEIHFNFQFQVSVLGKNIMEYAQNCKAKLGFTRSFRKRRNEVSLAIIGNGGKSNLCNSYPTQVNLAPTGIRSSKHIARSESLNSLFCPDPLKVSYATR
jgi:hypothetical protein